MTGTYGEIAVAVIGVIGLVLVELVRRDNKRTRSENTTQHAEGRSAIEDVKTTLGLVHTDVRETRQRVDSIAETVAVHEHEITELQRPREQP